MRKIFAPLFVAVLAVSLAACSSSGSSKSTGKSSTGAGACSASAPVKLTTVASNTLTVATNLPAPGFWNGDDPSSITGGFEYGMAQDIAKAAGLKDVKVVNVSFDALVAGQAQGYDLALSQVTITKDRAKVVDFSTPYFASDQGILAKKGTKVSSLADAQKLKWGVQTSTTGQTFLTDKVKPTSEPSVFQDTPSMFTALQAGQIQAVLLDTAIVLGQPAQSGGQQAVVGQFLSGEAYGAILPKGSKNRCAADAAIKKLAADGTLKSLVAKWLQPVFKGDPTKIPYISTK